MASLNMYSVIFADIRTFFLDYFFESIKGVINIHPNRIWHFLRGKNIDYRKSVHSFCTETLLLNIIVWAYFAENTLFFTT